MSDDLQPPDLTTWQRLFDDQTYWQQSPDAHYFDLQRTPTTCSAKARSIWSSGRSCAPRPMTCIRIRQP